MAQRAALTVALAIVLVLNAGCGAPASAPPEELSSLDVVVVATAMPTSPPTTTPLPPTNSPTPTPLTPTQTPVTTATPTLVPPTPAPEPTAPLLSFVDSGQRLGSARSADVSLGDLDGDSDLDAFVANEGPAGGGNAVWLNDGRGRFARSEQNLGSGTSVKLGDVDGDGDLDAFVVIWNNEPSTVWLNDGSGALTDSGQRLGGEACFGAALGDLDGDGDLDAVVAQLVGNTVWLNDGDGAFATTGQRLGGTITADVGLGDLDSDGDLDALSGGWDGPARVWLNDGEGAFTDSGHDLSAGHVHIHGIDLGDVDGDGDLDAFMAVASGDPNEVWLNSGDGGFTNGGQELRSPLAHAVSLADLDGDGDLDAFTAHANLSGRPGNRVWLNDGAGRFADSGLDLGDANSFGVALGDLDGDGDLDALAANGELWRNAGGGIPNEVWFNETISISGMLAFTSERDGDFEVYIMNADSVEEAPGRVQRLTNQPGEDYWTTWSPDGTQLAFASDRDGNFEIYTMNADGSNQQRLTHNTADDLEPDWSPDGTQIAFMYHSAGHSEIYVMDVDGGNRRQLTDSSGGNYQPDWSPDGTRILFVSERDGNPEIYVMNADGSNPQQLTENSSDDLYPAWSPDGTRVSFYSERGGGRGLFVVNVADAVQDPGSGNPQKLTSDDATVWVSDWSPDGTQIAFTSDRDGNREIYVVDVDGSNLRRLTNNRVLDGIPAWQPAATVPSPTE